MKIALAIALMAVISLVPPAQCGGNAAMEKELAAKQAEAYVNKGNAFYDQKQYDNALEQYTTSISLNPTAAAYWGRGRVYYFDSKKYSRATDEFSRAVEMDATYTNGYYYRGWSWVANGALDKALPDFNKVVALSSSSVNARYLRAWCLTNKANWDMSSLLYLYQIFESDAGLFAAFQGTGWHYVKDPQWELAANPDPVKSVEQGPSLAEAHCNRGYSLLKKAQWEQALNEYDKALKKDPALNRSDWNRDWVIKQLDGWNPVIAEYEKVIELISGKALPQEMKVSPGPNAALLDYSVASYGKAIELSKDPALTLITRNALAFIVDWRKEIAAK
jgi:tetratricopeptide (TPR) repeat protein